MNIAAAASAACYYYYGLPNGSPDFVARG